MTSANIARELTNGHLRIRVDGENGSYREYSLDVRAKGGWAPLGRGSFGRLVYRNQQDERRETAIVLSDATATDNGLRVSGTWTDADGLTWELSHEFRLVDDPRQVVVTARAVPAGSARVLHFSGPTFLAGEGAFGTKTTDALFPGLEYLGPCEPSSSTRFASAKLAERSAPHPYKITVPLMAVSCDGLAVGLLWDPNLDYCNAWRHPTAVFASPNHLDGTENHLLGLFAPGVPRFVEENGREAVRPIGAGPTSPITLEARLVALTGATSIDVLKVWVEVYGLPELEPPHSYRDNVELCVRSYLDVAWDETVEGWHHTLADPWGARYEPRVIAQLWRYAQAGGDPALKARARDQVRRGLERARKSGGGPENPANRAVVPHLELALHYGLLAESLAQTERQGRDLMAQQAADGSWLWQPELMAHPTHATEERRKVMGGADSSTGLTADRARNLLTWARITGDPAVREAGLRAVEWCNAQTRPEGAQTWELHLHVPDILAAPYLIDVNLDAHALTGDEQYLAQADRWAWTGLPFSYLWRAYFRPIMAYCSVPVFGVTFHDLQSWFGVDVHWNGLVYADALFRLAAATNEERWRTVALGLVACGMQQQPTAGPWLGMYPDAISLVRGEEEYTWWLNPNLIGLNTFELAGIPLDLDPRAVPRDGAEPVRVTSAARVQDASLSADRLSLTLGYPPGEASRTLIAGLDRPVRVRVGDRVVAGVDDLDAAEAGWQWLPEYRLLAVKVPHAVETVQVEIATG